MRKPNQPTAEGARCLNCGAPLTGPFCGHCGQRAHLHRGIGDAVHDVVHGITHFEGRFWKTLPVLLIRPGRRRARADPVAAPPPVRGGQPSGKRPSDPA